MQLAVLPNAKNNEAIVPFGCFMMLFITVLFHYSFGKDSHAFFIMVQGKREKKNTE
jgi:hypothetical protein